METPSIHTWFSKLSFSERCSHTQLCSDRSFFDEFINMVDNWAYKRFTHEHPEVKSQNDFFCHPLRQKFDISFPSITTILELVTEAEKKPTDANIKVNIIDIDLNKEC